MAMVTESERKTTLGQQKGESLSTNIGPGAYPVEDKVGITAKLRNKPPTIVQKPPFGTSQDRMSFDKSKEMKVSNSGTSAMAYLESPGPGSYEVLNKSSFSQFRKDTSVEETGEYLHNDNGRLNLKAQGYYAQRQVRGFKQKSVIE
jgi:hypothetical protein